MHLNYYFLQRLVPVLNEKLTATILVSAFSQDKDELVLEFGHESQVYLTIRAILKSDFTSLYFPEKFERARANSVDLFRGLLGQEVSGIFVYENERAFCVRFSSGEKLVFKLFGNRSNLLHFDSHGTLISIFNNRLAGDRMLAEASLSRPLQQTFEYFEENGADHRKLFPTFGKLINQYLEELFEADPDIYARWEAVQRVVADLREGPFYLVRHRGDVVLSLVQVGEILDSFDDPIAALNAFCMHYFRVGNLQREKDHASKRLEKSIGQTESYLTSAYEKLGRVSETGKNELYGNLLMAHLHLIEPRAETVELENFYTGEPVTIRLKPELSAVKNAEAFFRKGKNERLEIEQLQENIEAREARLAQMKAWLVGIAAQPTVKELRIYLKQNTLFSDSGRSEAAIETRFRKEEFLGYEIFIGKNAKNNDELTLKLARKEDLWLHAKDVSGSHVVVRSIPGRTVPNRVVERAAELAAWHSKRRNDSLCPVTVTSKKYVRKSKGMAAGAVVVEKESVVMVVPKA